MEKEVRTGEGVGAPGRQALAPRFLLRGMRVLDSGLLVEDERGIRGGRKHRQRKFMTF